MQVSKRNLFIQEVRNVLKEFNGLIPEKCAKILILCKLLVKNINMLVEDNSIHKFSKVVLVRMTINLFHIEKFSNDNNLKFEARQLVDIIADRLVPLFPFKIDLSQLLSNLCILNSGELFTKLVKFVWKKQKQYVTSSVDYYLATIDLCINLSKVIYITTNINTLSREDYYKLSPDLYDVCPSYENMKTNQKLYNLKELDEFIKREMNGPFCGISMCSELIFKVKYCDKHLKIFKKLKNIISISNRIIINVLKYI